MSAKKIIIIGAGPGGLAAAMILAHRGHQVMVLERADVIGGRNAPMRINGYTFDVGPTFVMLPQVFTEVFAMTGRKLSDYVEFISLDPLYRLRFGDGADFLVHYDKTKLRAEIANKFPGNEVGYDRWFAYHQKKFDRVYNCLTVPYQTPLSYLNKKLVRALPYLQANRTVWGVLGDTFTDDRLRMAMAFQSKYLGMSPKACPGTFSILSYTEHAFGVHHPRGGVHKISEAMAKVATEDGAEIRLNTNVKRVLTSQGRATGVELDNGTAINADEVVMNADFADGMTRLLDESDRPRYTNAKLRKMQYSCSTFMLYLGVDKKYDIPHHNIFFGRDYEQNLREIFDTKVFPSDPSFYIQNASTTDPSLAPAGKSTIYVLVPVPNLTGQVNWDAKKKEYRDLIVQAIMEKTELKDLAEHIEIERIITPQDWQDKVHVYQGATFNLAHTLNQMLYLRPHNSFNNLKHLYLVGGGTHPGSGLPTIVESGRITADLIGS